MLSIIVQNLKNFLAEMKEKGQTIVTTQQGEQLANELGAVKYMECSALTQKGLKAVFETSVRAVLDPSKFKRENKKKCNIL